MFDQIFGLPVHVLVVHAVVVLGPLAALTAIAYALGPRLRPNLKWWLVGFSIATGLSSLIAGESGEALEHRVKAEDGANSAAAQLVHDHAEAGDLMKAIGIIFMLAALAAVFALLPAGKEGADQGARAIVTKVVLVLLALAVLYQVVITGHTGAVAAWTN